MVISRLGCDKFTTVINKLVGLKQAGLSLQYVGLQRQSGRLASDRLLFRFRCRSWCGELYPTVVEIDAVLREAQALSFVVGEELRVEHSKVDAIVVFPVFGDEHVLHIEPPTHRSSRWLRLEPDLDDIDDLRQGPIQLRA